MKDIKILKLKNDDKYLVLTSDLSIYLLKKKIEKILNQKSVNKSSIILDTFLTNGDNENRFLLFSYNFKTGKIDDKAITDFPNKEQVIETTKKFFNN